MSKSNRNQKETFIQEDLRKVFSDTQKHIKISQMIQEHLSNQKDIRKTALHKLDLSQTKKILDLGCGFGYFTAGLKGAVHPEAESTGIDIHPHYEKHYLSSCKTAGIKGRFEGADIALINTFTPRSFDLIACSYSLYFFPQHIKRISSLLKPNGVFIAITHAIPHMFELTNFVKRILETEGIKFKGELPYESLIRSFSSENGENKLTPYFSEIKTYKCNSRLVFPDGDEECLIEYFRWKQSFFLPENNRDMDELIEHLMKEVKEEMKLNGKFEVSKNDAIFICSKPKI